MHSPIERIRTRVARHANPGSMETVIPSVSIAVARDDVGPEFMLRGPGVCLVIQGHKKVVIGGEAIRQDPGYTFAAVTELPMTRYLIAGNRGTPYLATGLRIDSGTLRALLSDLNHLPIRNVVPCFSIAEASRSILEAWDRLLELLDNPDDIPALAAARERELLYRLLMSEHGPLLRQVADDDDVFAQVRRVIDLMRVEFDKPQPVKRLADLAGMSVPAFNRRFRACTATSPLQYQKALQLEAARRMLAKANDVSRTATAVGYTSTSQFSREYKKFFGVQPKRDALSMQNDRNGNT